jgi:hypothetical protein
MTLLPCPHCGGDATVMPVKSLMKIVEYQAVCQATGCTMGIRSDTRDGAAAGWNRRAPITITTAMVAAGARVVLGRMSKRNESALQLVRNRQDLPIPKEMLDDVHAAFQAGLAMHARER